MTQANKPYTFVNGTTADANQVNQDFDILYNDVNGNLDDTNVKTGTLKNAIAIEGVTPGKTEGVPYAIDLFGCSFVLSGNVPTKDGTNAAQIDVPAYVAYILQSDGSLRRITTTATNFVVTIANATYYLDLNPDGTWSWAQSHSTQANYVPICTVTSDVSTHVLTITDTRVTFANAPELNVGEVGGKSVTDINQSYPTNLFAAFVYTGLTASKDGTTASKLDVTAGTAYLLQTDNTLHERDIAATNFTTSVVSTTYYLDLNPDGTWSWGTTHSNVTNYMPICSVATDASGNISTVTDTASRTPNMFPSLSSANLQIAGTQVVNRIVSGTYTGDGTTNRTINLGFTPSAVLVVNNRGQMSTYQSSTTVTFGGLAVTGNSVLGTSYTVLEVTTNGFIVHYQSTVDTTNTNGNAYYYIAFK